MISIDEALKEIFETRKIYERINIPKNTWHSYHQRFEKKELSHKKKREILTLLGWELAQPEMWKK